MLTKQEKELLEECMDELYEDFATYQETLRLGEQMNVTYQLFLSIVQKLDLRKPKLSAAKPSSQAKPQAKTASKPAHIKARQGRSPQAGGKRPPFK